MKEVYESKVHKSMSENTLNLNRCGGPLLNSELELKELVGGYWLGRGRDRLQLFP